jgi:aryl-phospho-beta-D-glucosidase BglC (GH1 family)
MRIPLLYKILTAANCLWLPTSCALAATPVAPPVATASRDDYATIKSHIYTFDFSSVHSHLPIPTAQQLPPWHGFNLLNMFIKGIDKPFVSADFKTIHDLGYNFARLPLDYRIFTYGGSWDDLDESALENLDHAMTYAIQNDIHVWICLHRAPGYTVATPAEAANLWTDKSAQEAFAKMWGMLAHRYQQVPNQFLSFNLVNEPPDIKEDTYVKAIKPAIDAIRAVTPDRLIVADGLAWGSKPLTQAKALGIALATRGYYPITLTHYHASWMHGADQFPLPQWPEYLLILPCYLYGNTKPDIQSPLVINGDFKEDYHLALNVQVVSSSIQLVMLADDKPVFDKVITSGKGTGDWKTEVYNRQYGIYQKIFDRDYPTTIPAGTKPITIKVTHGDWMTFNRITLAPVATASLLKPLVLKPSNRDWGERQTPITLSPDNTVLNDPAVNNIRSSSGLIAANFQPWLDTMNSGVGVMVGEWGAHNQGPHDVVLAWMKDWLSVWKQHGVGWAMWNFTGSFGIVNNGYHGIQYHSFEGYDIDQPMLDLLNQYK